MDNFSRVTSEPKPLSADFRKQFGKVALMPADMAQDVVFTSPDALKDPAPPWAIKTFNRLASATQTDDISHRTSLADPRNYYDLGRMMCILVVSGGAALTEGIFCTVSQSKLDASLSAVKRALDKEPLQPGIETTVRQMALAGNCNQLVAIPEAELLRLKSQTATNRSFSALTNSGIDSVLILRVNRQQFGVVRRLNPPTTFAISVDVYLCHAGDGSYEYFRTVEYESLERKFTDWGAKDAIAMRAEIKQAEYYIAEAIVTELFDLDPSKL